MSKYKAYLLVLGMLCYLFIYPVIRVVWYLVALFAAMLLYIFIMLSVFSVLFTIVIRSSIGFDIVLFIAILGLFGGVLWAIGISNHFIYKAR